MPVKYIKQVARNTRTYNTGNKDSKQTSYTQKVCNTLKKRVELKAQVSMNLT